MEKALLTDTEDARKATMPAEKNTILIVTVGIPSIMTKEMNNNNKAEERFADTLLLCVVVSDFFCREITRTCY